MELQKPPFYPESFLNHKRYRDARQEFLEKEYIGKTVIFNSDLIDISGNVMHMKGTEVEIIAIDCDLFKVRTEEGIIHALFNPRTFDYGNN